MNINSIIRYECLLFKSIFSTPSPHNTSASAVAEIIHHRRRHPQHHLHLSEAVVEYDRVFFCST